MEGIRTTPASAVLLKRLARLQRLERRQERAALPCAGGRAYADAGDGAFLCAKKARRQPKPSLEKTPKTSSPVLSSTCRLDLN